MLIETAEGEWLKATQVRHLRTLTATDRGRIFRGTCNVDVDLYRLESGREVVAQWNGDARSKPVIDPSWPIPAQ